MARKSIVLSDVENTNKKAVMTIEENNLQVKGTLRLYNFSREIEGIASVGIYADKKVFKCGLTRKSNMFYEFFVDMPYFPDKFSCAVVNFVGAQAKPILFGTSQETNEQIYGEIISQISQNNSFQNTKNVLDKFEVDYEIEEKKEIEKEIERGISSCCDCENCVYKKSFYENENKSENTKKLNTDAIFEEKTVQNPKFYEKLKPQIDKLFSTNPLEESLQNSIPNSKWVKVEYEDEGDFYVFGLLYDEMKNIKFVCYGIPAIFSETPPDELGDFPIWFSFDKNASDGFGYWICCQDAQTGEQIDVKNL